MHSTHLMLNESTIDTEKLYFHGSSEKRVTKLDPPSYEHPFYVTTDLHYAMAFCTKTQSSTGEYHGIQKTFTPSDSNYVYVITLKPNCKVLDFRRKSGSNNEYQILHRLADPNVVEWMEKNSVPAYEKDDFYEFVTVLRHDVLVPAQRFETYRDYVKLFGIDVGDDERVESKDLEAAKQMLILPKSIFYKGKKLLKKLGLDSKDVYKLDTHEVMAPFLKELARLGYQGVVACERDYNDDDFRKVSTDYAIGIFDKSALDLMSLVPMKYKWLKEVNPDYVYDHTNTSSYSKIKRFVQLYKKIVSTH